MKTLFEVNGFEVKEGSLYKVIPRMDKSAPDGYQTVGTTKIPDSRIGNTVSCPYHITDQTSKQGVYDTGLYPESPCYNGKNREATLQIVKKLKEVIVTPFENKRGKEVLDHQNLEFWDKFGTKIYDGKVFFTDNPDHLLELYTILRRGALAPVDDTGNPRFRNAQFCIQDREKVKTARETRISGLLDVMEVFKAYYDTDIPKLTAILKYSGAAATDLETDKDSVRAAFYEWANANTDNVDKFNRAVDMEKDDKKSEVIHLYSKLTELHRQRKLTKVRSEFEFAGVSLGADLKTAAQKLVSREDLEDIKEKILEL